MLDPSPERTTGPDTTPTPSALQAPPPGSTTEMVPEGADPQRVGDLLTTWVGIVMDTVDAMVADAQAKVDALPEYRTLMLLIGELTVRMVWLETEVERLKGERR
jgi:hypothetical protein